MLHWAQGKPPRRSPPQKRKSDLPAGDAVTGRAVLPRERDPRQAGIFDAPLPAFVRSQLAKLVTEAPDGDCWAHELKFDGYRVHARIDRGRVKLITERSALDWTGKYPGLADWLRVLPVARAYLDGELCAVRPDGTTSFSLMQAATEGLGDRLGSEIRRAARMGSPLSCCRGAALDDCVARVRTLDLPQCPARSQTRSW